MQPNQSGVHRREKILPKKEHKPHGQRAEDHKAGRKQAAMVQRRLQQLLVSGAEPIESPLEPALEPSQKTLRLPHPVLVPAHDVHDHGRDQRS